MNKDNEFNISDFIFLDLQNFLKLKKNIYFKEKEVVNINLSNCFGGDKLFFKHTDLTKTSFIYTDLRKTDFNNVIWNKENERIIFYDEQNSIKNNNFNALEKLYRELKQNFEDRKDYILAGEFNISEKEIKLKNPNTNTLIKVVLYIFKILSNYNESILRPFLWLLWLFLLSGLFYYSNVQDFDIKQSLHESLRAMFLFTKALNPENELLINYTLEKILSPILIWMLGLSINQKLKR